MKRLWTAFLTSLLTVSASLAQSTSPPSPRPLTPAPLATQTQQAPAAPSASPTPDVGPINPETGMPLSGPESYGETFETGSVRGRREFWGSVDYIFWWGKRDIAPPLVTTSPAGTSIATAGVLGNASTTTLFGGPDRGLNDDGRSGVKFEFGGWLDSQRTFGLQAGTFFLGDSSTGRTFSSDGTTILARPFTSTATGAASQLVAFNDPIGNVVSGSITPRELTSVEGFDVAFRSLGCCGPCWRFDTLVGYRNLHLSDHFKIEQDLLIGPRGALVGAPPGATVNSFDEFDTTNDFNGAEFGITGEYRFCGAWTIDGTIKASYGVLNDRSTITGGTTSTSAGVTASSTGGLLALPGTNINSITKYQGQLVPELNFNLAYQISDRARLRVGYTFLYLDNVFRAGDRIDTTINPAFVPFNPAPGATIPVRPVQLNTQTEYILQGLNVGLEIRF